MSRTPRVGWLFAHDWDGAACDRLQAAGLARFDRAGFDLFGFPSQLGLPVYDHERFARAQALGPGASGDMGADR